MEEREQSVKEYWWDHETGELHVNIECTRPFLCASEATPLRFGCAGAAVSYLEEQGISNAVVLYKLQQIK